MANGDQLPILIAPRPELAERANRGGGPSDLVLPPHDRQAPRTGRRLSRLQSAFERRAAQLQEELAGVEPELALVFETVGEVQDFRRAVRRVRGMEWLVEIEDPDMPPDEDFYRERSPEANPGGIVYLVMSDRAAVDQLMSLWRTYSEDGEFPYGLTKFRDVFKHLRDIRLWGPRDRVRETGLLTDWQEMLAFEGAQLVAAQAEFWFRESASARSQQVARLRGALALDGGETVGDPVAIPEIGYHGCVLRVPRATAHRLVHQDEDIATLSCESVMFLRPVGQLGVPRTDVEPGPVEIQLRGETPVGRPVAALLDGVPMQGHNAIAGRITLDDPDGWEAEVPARERVHGTAMASVMIHGDLADEAASPLRRPIYVRPILRPRVIGGRVAHESIPDDRLDVDLVHEAVRRILVGPEAVAPEVTVINLSIGDVSRPFHHTPSPLARLLDWLSWEYQVLFVVSAGNAVSANRLDLSCSRDDFLAMDPEGATREIWRALENQSHLRRVLAPAEAVNALTVGASHRDASDTGVRAPLVDPYASVPPEAPLPSPVSSLGGGIGRALKPELLHAGGRLPYRLSIGGPTARLDSQYGPATPPGVSVATPGPQGDVRASCFTRGTSAAAAAVTREAAMLSEQFDTVVHREGQTLPPRHVFPSLLKAMVAHPACWQEGRPALEQLSPTQRIDRTATGRQLGYGSLRYPAVIGCTEQRVTLVGWGELDDGQAHVYSIGLPACLDELQGWRRVTVTLGWTTPVNPKDRRYRRGQIWFEVFPGRSDQRAEKLRRLGLRRTQADPTVAQRGTLQHEVFEGTHGRQLGDLGDLELKVNCRDHAGLEEAIPYGLVISIEVAPELALPIYQQVRDRIQPAVVVRAGT